MVRSNYHIAKVLKQIDEDIIRVGNKTFLKENNIDITLEDEAFNLKKKVKV